MLGPNISGYSGYAMNKSWNGSQCTISGPFTYKTQTMVNMRPWNSGGGENPLFFNASLASSVFGSSGTVQSPALLEVFIMKCA